MSHLLCLGLGYSARVLARRLHLEGWRITGSARTAEGTAKITGAGYEGLLFDAPSAPQGFNDTMRSATHLLISAAPDAAGDPILAYCSDLIASAPNLTWIGYLSTIGVYGDHGGRWVDEDTPATPGNARSQHRLAAENAWLTHGKAHDVPVQVFRLAGIYGPGRSAIDQLRAGRARRIDKPGQVFNRIHVDDIATLLKASIAQPRAGRIYNVADGNPTPPTDVVAFGAELLGLPVPPLVPFADAGLSKMGRSFYSENKRVSNKRILAELGVTLAYPTYRDGLRAIAGLCSY